MCLYQLVIGKIACSAATQLVFKLLVDEIFSFYAALAACYADQGGIWHQKDDHGSAVACRIFLLISKGVWMWGLQKIKIVVSVQQALYDAPVVVKFLMEEPTYG